MLPPSWKQMKKLLKIVVIVAAGIEVMQSMIKKGHTGTIDYR
jgi:hypothetical protein